MEAAKASANFLDIMLSYQNLGTMIAAWVLVGVVGKMFPKLARHPIGARLQPLAPFLFTGILCFLPGLQADDMAFGERIMLALVLGFGAGHVHKIVKQTVFGSDERIQNPDPKGLEDLKK